MKLILKEATDIEQIEFELNNIKDIMRGKIVEPRERIRVDNPQTCDTVSEYLNLLDETTALEAGVMIAGGLIGYAMGTIFKNRYSKAGKACGGMSGREGKECRKKFRIDALKAEAIFLKNSIGKCRNDINPQSCKQKIQNRILVLTKQIKNVKKPPTALFYI